MRRSPFAFSVLILSLALHFGGSPFREVAAEVVSISERNWQEYAPQGKEADWIVAVHSMRMEERTENEARGSPACWETLANG